MTRLWNLLLILVLLGPRAFRMLWPEVWVEDADYLHAGLLISRGCAPYRDFVCPHFPVLEAFLGLAYYLVGSSVRVAEFLTQTAVLLTGYILYRITTPTKGKVQGLLVALLYGCASLVFRYHLFEREIYTNLTGALLIGLALAKSPPGSRLQPLASRTRLPAMIGLATLGLLLKLTTGWEILAVVVFLFCIRKERKQAVLLCLGAGLLLGFASLTCYLAFGDRFLLHVWLFHFFKGAGGGVSGSFRVLFQSLDLSGAIGFAGLGALLLRRYAGGKRLGETDKLMMLWLCCPLVFYLFLSPTFWEHNLIFALIPLAYFGPSLATVTRACLSPKGSGFGRARDVRVTPEPVIPDGANRGSTVDSDVSKAVALFRKPDAVTGSSIGALGDDDPINSRSYAVPSMSACICAGVSILLLVGGLYLFPLRNHNWKLGARYGFGYRSREQLREAAREIRAESDWDDLIVAPPLVAVEAGRRKMIHYREVAIPMKKLESLWDREGWSGLHRMAGEEGFFDRLKRLTDGTARSVAEAIRGDGAPDTVIPVVVPDSREILFSEFRIPEAFLDYAGYEEVYVGRELSVWALRRRERTAPTR